jgi:hypothetical protein
MRAHWPSAALAGVVLLLAAWLHAGVALNHDVAWLLTAAGRMAAGGHYAADFFEINMPLAIAVYIPPVEFARLSGIELAQVSSWWTLLLAAQALLLILRQGVLAPGFRGLVQVAWLGAGLALFPAYDFAQREHLALLLFLPFLFLPAAPNPSMGLRVYVSLLAAAGFFLKPHLAGLPVLLLAAEALRTRDWAPLRSIEAAVLLGVGLVYAGVVVLLFPDWFVCARWAQDLYGVYRSQLPQLLSVPGVAVFAAVAALEFAAAGFSADFRRTAAPFLLGAAYCIVAYLLQDKGWRYQFLPAALLLWTAQGLLLPYMLRLAGRALAVCAVAAALLMVCATVAAWRDLPRASQLPRSAIGQALAIAGKGDSVYVLSTAMSPAFPSVVLLGLNWGSRFGTLWPVAGLLGQSNLSAAEQRRFAIYRKAMVADLAEDLAHYRPGLVLVDRRSGQFGLPRGYDLLDFFADNAVFGAQWANYKEIGRNGDYVIFARDTDADTTAAAPAAK